MTLISRLFLALCLGLGGLSQPVVAQAETLTVFAAASLRDALEEVGEAWQASHASIAASEAGPETSLDLRFSFAGSSALARQVEAGAPADLVILANALWMDHLIDRGAIRPDTRVDLIGNRLVLAGPKEGNDASPEGAPPVTWDRSIRDRLGDDRFAMALVTAVPAGIYGRQALEAIGLWQDIAPQVAQTDNVRAALALIALGEVAMGIVYASDVVADPRVIELAAIPADSHAPIRYPAAIPRDGTSAKALELLQFLQTPIAKEIFLRHGFQALPN